MICHLPLLPLHLSIAAADEVVKRVHKLLDIELQVRFLQEPARKPADTLEVSGLPEGISEDLIELYFENAKSGGCAGAIKSISFLGPTTACIQCTSDEGKGNCTGTVLYSQCSLFLVIL